MANANYDVKFHLRWWFKPLMRMAWLAAGVGIAVPRTWLERAFKRGMKVELCKPEN